MEEICIRTAKLEDAKRLVEIYTPYVEETAITFEYDVPSVKEFERRIEEVLCCYPYIVAERKDCRLCLCSCLLCSSSLRLVGGDQCLCRQKREKVRCGQSALPGH